MNQVCESYFPVILATNLGHLKEVWYFSGQFRERDANLAPECNAPPRRTSYAPRNFEGSGLSREIQFEI